MTFRARYLQVTWLQEVAAGVTVGALAVHAGETQYRTDDGRELWLPTSQFQPLFSPIGGGRYAARYVTVEAAPAPLGYRVASDGGASAFVDAGHFSDVYVPILATELTMDAGVG